MANQDWAFGLQAIRGPHGESPKVTRLPLRQAIQTTKYTTAIFKGAIVLWGASGWLKANDSGTPHNNNAAGVAQEFYAGSATTQTSLGVWGPEHDFVIQSDGGTTSTAQVDYMMMNFDVTNFAAGDTNTGYSGMELDFSTGELTTVTHTIQVHGIQKKVGEDGTGANMNVIVKFLPGIGIGQTTAFG